MSCEYCTDPDGAPCFPIYGVGPHTHEGRDGNPLLGATVLLPRNEWPENYREDPNAPGHGVWWCPHCGDGKPEEEGRSKYHREIKPGVFVDVYDVLHAFCVTNPALQHLVKKALAPGQRGHKDRQQDLDEIVASAIRARQLG